MAWPWKRGTATAPGAPSDPPNSDPDVENLPLPLESTGNTRLPSEATFLVDRVYNSRGLGCEAAGEVTQGILRPSMEMRLQRGAGDPPRAGTIIVAQILGDRKEVAEIGPGVKVGLVLRGLVTLPGIGRHVNWDQRKGDLLMRP
jgi:hypothetical protein